MNLLKKKAFGSKDKDKEHKNERKGKSGKIWDRR